MAGRLKKAVFKFIRFSKKQKKVFTWWFPESGVSDKDGIIADGAIRAGKTVSVALSFVFWAMETFEYQNFGLCGKTIGSFRRNVLWSLILMLRTRGYKTKYHRSDNLLEVYRKGKVNYFYVFGGKDESSQDLIQGITLAGVLFDEVALMPESFVNQAVARCSVDGSKFWFNCNPDGPNHWFKVNWIDKVEEKNLLYLHFTMDDNLSLSEKVKERYKSMYSGVFFKRFILGLWVAAEGIVYDMFDEAKHVLNKLKDLIGKGQYISIDYGTQNATVFLLWEKNTHGQWICIKEYYYAGRKNENGQKTDSQYADDLEEFAVDEDGKRLHLTSVIVDPSAASFIAELKGRGWIVKKAKNDVLDGIRLTSTLLNLKALLFTDTCIETIKEFQTYSWDDKAIERGEDAPLKEYDHCMDAVRYFVYTILRKEPKYKPENIEMNKSA